MKILRKSKHYPRITNIGRENIVEKGLNRSPFLWKKGIMILYCNVELANGLIYRHRTRAKHNRKEQDTANREWGTINQKFNKEFFFYFTEMHYLCALKYDHYTISYQNSNRI